MPVSKKRKKGGKTVHRKPATEATASETPHAPSGAEHAAPRPKLGKGANPFLAGQQVHRGAARGR